MANNTYYPDSNFETPTGTTTVDLVGGKFSDGDINHLPSRVPAQWFNNITEQLMRVVTDAGLSINLSQNDNLVKAIIALIKINTTQPVSFYLRDSGIFFTRKADGTLPASIDSDKVFNLSDQLANIQPPDGLTHIELPINYYIYFELAGAGGSWNCGGGGAGKDSTPGNIFSYNYKRAGNTSLNTYPSNHSQQILIGQGSHFGGNNGGYGGQGRR